MRVLVLCDDRWHPASTPRQGLEPLMNADFEFDFIENAGDWSAARMGEYPLVMLTKSNDVSSIDQTDWATDQVEQVFIDYVRRGGGLLIVHSGTAGYKETLQLRALMGGVFAHHLQQCPVTAEPQEGHPLTLGSASFTLKDEHYFMELDDTRADVFMTTTSEHGTQPGGWTRTEGKGRVCVLTPGHTVEVWQHSAYQALLRNALLWCVENDASR
jgi:uncharacterized protein